MKEVLTFLTSKVPSGNKTTPIVRRVAAEMFDELAEIPPEFIEFYVKQLANALYWAATGDGLDDMPHPLDVMRETGVQ